MTTTMNRPRPAPVYASRAAREAATRIGVELIEVEVGRRLNRAVRWDRAHEQREHEGWWVHTGSWSARIAPTPARTNPEREAWLVVEVRRP